MPTIYCPNCEQVIPDNATVCESCGFDLASVDEEAVSIPTKEGVIENNVLNINKKVPAGQGKNLSEEEIQRLIAGDLVKLSVSDEEEARLVESAPIDETQATDIAEKAESTIVSDISAKSPDNTLAAISDETLTDIFADKSEISEEISPVTEPPTETRKSGKLLRPLITVAAVVVAAVIGFLVCYVLFCMKNVSFETEFSLRAAKAVQSTCGGDEMLIVYASYVKFDSASTECIIFGVVQNGVNNDTLRKYRVVVSNEESNVVKVYFELGDGAYNAMKESGDPETVIQASVLKNYSDIIMSSAESIASGNKKWFKADSSYVNTQLELLRVSETSAAVTTTTTASE